jgi:hypothetical protein
MKTYLPDTNVLVDFGRNRDVKAKLEKARYDGAKFVIAPPTLTELSVGVVKGGAAHFAQNKQVFGWPTHRELRDLRRVSPAQGRAEQRMDG